MDGNGHKKGRSFVLAEESSAPEGRGKKKAERLQVCVRGPTKSLHQRYEEAPGKNRCVHSCPAGCISTLVQIWFYLVGF